MNLTITDDMIIKFITGVTEYTIDKMILNKNGTDYEIYDGGSTPAHDYSQDYFTIESLEDSNSIQLTRANTNTPTFTYYYSTDDGTTWTSYSGEKTWSLNTGDKLMIKATTNQWGFSNGYWNFKSSKEYDVYGNIMSLIYGDNFENQKTIEYEYEFYNLFYARKSSYLKHANNLVLPATTLTNRCYYQMFYGCNSMVAAPSKLPATTLANECYSTMFQKCSSLTTAPELPATTLANNCYSSMFSDCTSLISAPELPATNLAKSCYYMMFISCSALTIAPELPATNLAESCYEYMFSWCSSLTTVPELPATTLVTSCYNRMFYKSSNLNYINCLATNISASNCLYDWVGDVAATGTFVKAASMSSWPAGTSGIPSGWTVQDAA